MTSLLCMLRHLQGTEQLLSYFLVMEQMCELKITICMSLSCILILFGSQRIKINETSPV